MIIKSLLEPEPGRPPVRVPPVMVARLLPMLLVTRTPPPLTVRVSVGGVQLRVVMIHLDGRFWDVDDKFKGVSLPALARANT